MQGFSSFNKRSCNLLVYVFFHHLFSTIVSISTSFCTYNCKGIKLLTPKKISEQKTSFTSEGMCFDVAGLVLSWKITWSLKIAHLKRKIIGFYSSILVFQKVYCASNDVLRHSWYSLVYFPPLLGGSSHPQGTKTITMVLNLYDRPPIHLTV